MAVISTPLPKGRLLSESIALAEARGTTAIPDEDFMKDVEEGRAELINAAEIAARSSTT